MNTLKVTKWFGFSLLCLIILTIPLALAGLYIAQDVLDSFSQANPAQEDGKQIDQNLSGLKMVQTAPDWVAEVSEDLPSEAALPQNNSSRIDDQQAGGVSMAKPDGTLAEPASTGQGLDLHPDGIYRMGGIAALDPSNGGGHYPMGRMLGVDRTSGPDWLSPADGMYETIPAGYAKVVDPHIHIH